MTSTAHTNRSAPHVLVHTCCAHCLEQFLSRVPSQIRCTPIILFDNCNIHPRTEYLARLKALQLLVERNNLELIVADWSPKKWFEAIKGWEKEGKAERCRRCWEFRLIRTIQKARNLEIKKFSTTMLASNYLNTEKITQIATDLAQDLEFVAIDPPDEDNRTAPDQPRYYMQNYCGCSYSLVERYEEKFTCCT